MTVIKSDSEIHSLGDFGDALCFPLVPHYHGDNGFILLYNN